MGGLKSELCLGKNTFFPNFVSCSLLRGLTLHTHGNEDKYLSNYHNFMQLCVPWELVQCRAACSRGQDKM